MIARKAKRFEWMGVLLTDCWANIMPTGRLFEQIS